ncbi:unnamed protein product, partial [Coffea canephora]
TLFSEAPSPRLCFLFSFLLHLSFLLFYLVFLSSFFSPIVDGLKLFSPPFSSSSHRRSLSQIELEVKRQLLLPLYCFRMQLECRSVELSIYALLFFV